MKNNRPIEVGQVRMIPKSLYDYTDCYGEITSYVVLSYNSEWVHIQYLLGKYKGKKETIHVRDVMKEVVVM